MSGPAESKYGVAYAPEGPPLFVLPETGPAKGWKTMVLTLKDGVFSDFLTNNLGCPLCSEKLKNIIDKTSSAHDEIQWLPTIVADEKGKEEKKYFILHFPTEYDILDRKKSIIVEDDFVVKPVISKKLAANHAVFTFLGEGQGRFFISERVKEAIEKEGCLGIVFEKAAAT